MIVMFMAPRRPARKRGIMTWIDRRGGGRRHVGFPPLEQKAVSTPVPLISNSTLGSCVVAARPHRADVSKMLVHRRARRQGIATALMKALEDAAREYGKTLLVLDTADATAEGVYERTGWTRVGTIPNYALMPDGGPCDTVVFYRDLSKKGTRQTRFENIQPILRVADIKRSLAYYLDVLGFTKAPWGDLFTAVVRDRCSLYLCQGSQGNRGTWVWAGVEDTEQLYAEYKARGAIIRVPPRNYPWALEM